MAVFLHKSLLDDDEVASVLDDLDRYPLINEDTWSELEMMAQQDAWDDWGRCDFKRELKELGVDEDWLSFVEDELIDSMFYKAQTEANEYWVEEPGGNMWINLGKIAEKFIEMYGKMEEESNG